MSGFPVTSPGAIDQTTAYAEAVTAGRIIAGRPVRKACERHLRDLEQGHKRGLVWRPDLAQRAIAFIAQLRLGDGEHAGLPFVLGAWQAFIVGSLFGWLGADGFRRFRTAYVEIGKGNGKTPLAAAISLYMLYADGEHGAEVYSAAVTRAQAGICFRDAVRFVQGNATLMRASVPGLNNIAFPSTSSYMRTLAAEGRSLDGLRVHFASIDELHEHRTSMVVDKVRAGTKGRRQALIFEITNSGHDRTSVCWQHHQLTLRILDGVVENDSWFGYIAALDAGDDPLTDEACWIKANPNLGVSITIKYLREQVAEAREIPSRRNIVLRLNFCVWTESSSRWLDMDRWDACADVCTPEQLRGRECFGGLDLASTTDVAALVWLFPPIDTDPLWRVVARFWVPQDNIHRRSERDGTPYADWARDGHIAATSGNVIDYDVIRQAVLDDAEIYAVREIAIDRWNATQLSTQLIGEGLNVVGFGQGFASMSAPSKLLEALVLGRELAHGGNEVLRWMATNVAIAQDPAGNVKPDKGKSTEKIDGIVALVMALGRASVTAAEEAPGIY